jgi:hypothetical protein
MSHHDAPSPALLPVLSRGKHRNPRKGACFMEFASLLAGERWSDHPACTHPLLAAVARHVNDHTSDAGRQRLAGLIPSVIGLTGDDLHIDARIALGSATMALPVVAADRQRVMAVSVLSCDRILAELDGRPADALEGPSRAALAKAPQAAQWAYQFTSGVRLSTKGFRRQAAPTMVGDAVEGIAQACVPDPDGMLRDLLVQAIDVCVAWLGRDRIAVGWSITTPSLTSGNVGDHLMSRVEEATSSDQGNTGPLHRRGRLADQVDAEGTLASADDASAACREANPQDWGTRQCGRRRVR